MKLKLIKIVISLITALICSYLLVTGNQILEKPISSGLELPWGNVISWIGLTHYHVQYILQ